MLMMTSQILKSVDFTKAQFHKILKSRERNIAFSSNKTINYMSRATLLQKIVLWQS